MTKKKKKDNKEASKPKTYKDIITKDAVTDKGLFDVHKVKEKYYYEINDSLLRKRNVNGNKNC